MNLRISMLGSLASGLLMSGSLFAGTLSGTIAYKNSENDIVVKSGQVEFDEQDVSRIKLAIQDHGDVLAEKIKVARFHTENRTVVLAAFKNIGDMPSNTSIIVKANLLDGNNGKLLYGDVFKRSCEKGYADALSDHDGALERLLFAVRERKGCEMNYIGGVLLTSSEK